MKNYKITLNLFLLLIAMTIINLNAQPPDCHDASYDAKVDKKAYTAKLVKVYDPTAPIDYLPGCTGIADTFRYIGFVHGLGGDANSWDKQAIFTQNTYSKTSDAVVYKGFETSFFATAKRLNLELHGYMGASINTSRPNRCKNGDYVICHSQGGLVARYLDSAWNVDDVNYGNRKFSGIVTFGTPNDGSDIAFSKNEHKDFVQKVISSVLLHSLNETVNNVATSRFGSVLGNTLINGMQNLDTFIKNTIAPLMLAGEHTPTLDEMRPNSSLMNSLRSHHTQVHRVAIYGIEEAPECWRILDNVLTKKPHEYALWEADTDTSFMNKAERIRVHYLAKLTEERNNLKKVINTMNIPVYGLFRATFGGVGKANQLREIIKKREDAVTFFDNANTQWRFLIGSFHKDSVETVTLGTYTLSWTEVVTTKVLGKIKVFNVNRSIVLNDMVAVNSFFANLPIRLGNRLVNGSENIVSVYKTVTRLQFFPSDGIVLAKRQVKFPGVLEQDTRLMPNTNHQQMRNNSETKDALRELYNGGRHDDFFRIKFWD